MLVELWAAKVKDSGSAHVRDRDYCGGRGQKPHLCLVVDKTFSARWIGKVKCVWIDCGGKILPKFIALPSFDSQFS